MFLSLKMEIATFQSLSSARCCRQQHDRRLRQLLSRIRLDITSIVGFIAAFLVSGRGTYEAALQDRRRQRLSNSFGMVKRRNDHSLPAIVCAIVAGSSCRQVGARAATFTVDTQRLVGGVLTGPQYSSSLHVALQRKSSDLAAHYKPLLVVRTPIDRLDYQLGGVQDYGFVRALSCRGGQNDTLRLSKYFVGSRSRCWAVLFMAILIDSCTITMMKVAQDEGSVAKLAISYFGYFLSMFGFALSLNSLDISIAYAVWAAVGTAIVSTVGIVKFNEDFDVAKLGCLAMIVLGVIGLNLRGS